MSLPVVVGVDGSAGSERALAWAMRHALLAGSTVKVVCAWEPPPLGGTFTFGDPEVLRKAARDVVDRVTASSAADAAPIEASIVEGHPAQVLVRESRGAQLLVLGARGSGGFTEMLLGSVTDYCSHHAGCPVVIVRG